MSEKISRRIFIAELIVIALPSAILLLVATVDEIHSAISYFLWPYIINAFLALSACTAVVSGLIISKNFLTRGAAGLHNLKPILWILSLIGVILPIVAEISTLLPPPPEYSLEEMFRFDFKGFVLGFPMYIPLVHLVLEFLFRKLNKPNLPSTK